MFSSQNSQVSSAANYIEDVFNTYVWTGTGSNQTLTTNVDTSTYGGLFWTKNRTNAYDHALWSTDFSLSGNYLLKSNTTGALTYGTYNTGDYVSNSTTGVTVYGNPQNYVTWTFRKQPKFFDVVTYTGDGTTTQTINHNLGCQPGFILLKATSSSGSWFVLARSDATNYKYLFLNSTNGSGGNYAQTSCASDTQINLGYIANNIDSFFNLNGTQYVAYLFAHNAGGFGLTGTDNVISCGSFTTNGSGNFSVTLGYEPQWVMIKSTNNTGVSAAQQNWIMMDNMRGFVTQSGTGARLRANTSEAESTTNDFGPTATGFESLGNMSASAPFIYIAIRKGPMKVPTSGTSVFSPVASSATTGTITSGFPTDMVLSLDRTTGISGYNRMAQDRLRGAFSILNTTTTDAEYVNTSSASFDSNAGIVLNGGTVYANGFVHEQFRRAPSFFDEVCYTGNGSSNNAKTHNLGVAPELLIIKNRSSSGSGDWYTFHTFTSSNFKKQLLDTTDAQTNYTYGSFLDAQPTSTTFTVNSGAGCNESGVTYVAYLFATCAGVSKVGSYTGTGTTKQVDCGFTGGARFVLIKRTDSTGDWYVWDTARGIVSGNDPYLLLNSTAAEVTNTDYVDTYSAGFEISSTAPAAINASGGTYIFLAIA